MSNPYKIYDLFKKSRDHHVVYLVYKQKLEIIIKNSDVHSIKNLSSMVKNSNSLLDYEISRDPQFVSFIFEHDKSLESQVSISKTFLGDISFFNNDGREVKISVYLDSSSYIGNKVLTCINTVKSLLSFEDKNIRVYNNDFLQIVFPLHKNFELNFEIINNQNLNNKEIDIKFIEQIDVNNKMSMDILTPCGFYLDKKVLNVENERHYWFHIMYKGKLDNVIELSKIIFLGSQNNFKSTYVYNLILKNKQDKNIFIENNATASLFKSKPKPKLNKPNNTYVYNSTKDYFYDDDDDDCRYKNYYGNYSSQNYFSKKLSIKNVFVKEHHIEDDLFSLCDKVLIEDIKPPSDKRFYGLMYN